MEGGPNNERTVVIKDHSLRQFDGGFTSIPNRILENNVLSLGARMTYAMLLKYAWQKDFCFPAQQQLANDLGITDRSVRTFLAELREHELISWKQLGLNRPNIYYILKLPARTSTPSHSGPENISGPDRKQIAGQDRKQASDKEHSPSNTHKVVNDVTVNDPTKRNRSGRGSKTPTISRRALRRTYGLDDRQIDRVAALVDRQAGVLGAIERNHAGYVERAAEAVRDGRESTLDRLLGEFKQAARKTVIGSEPAYFHAMYSEALEDYRDGQPARPLRTAASRKNSPDEVDPTDTRAHLILDAERRGFAVPNHIRSGDTATVSLWWTGLASSPDQRPTA